jgi:hypothetical protein
MLKFKFVETEDQICIYIDREANDLIELIDSEHTVVMRAEGVKFCFGSDTEGPQIMFGGEKGPDAQVLQVW